MNKIKHLREKRAEIYEQSKELLDKADDESRALTDEESTSWDAMHAEIDKLGHQIEQHEKDESIARAIDGNYNQPLAYAELDNQNGDDLGENWFDKRSGRPIQVLERGESYGRGLDVENELRGLTLGGWLRSIAGSPRSDVEHRALSEGTTTAGGFTVPTILLPEFIDRLRAATVIGQAGARTVQLTSDAVTMARLATDPVTGWHTENSAESASDPTFEQIAFAVKTLISLVRVSRELVEDSVNIDSMLSNALVQSMAVELDRVALSGAGSAIEPKGLDSVTNVGTVAHAATLTNYDPILSAFNEVLIDNAPMPKTIVMHPRDWVTFQKLKDTTNQPLQVPPALSDKQWLTTTGVAITGGSPQEESTIYVGDFRSMMVGVRHSIVVEVLKERYAEFFQFAFLAHLRADIQVEHGESFAMVQAILPTP